MKLHQLQALVSAADHGSIRAAARALHLTQAALTKSLRQLEDGAGVPLIVRQSRGVSLTDAGQRLLLRARLVTRQIEMAREDMRSAQGDEAGQLSVALTPFLMLTVLGEGFRWFRKRYPKVQLRLMEGLVTRVLPALRDGSVDFAIVADSGDVPTRDFSVTHLQRQEQTLVVRANHPLLHGAPTAAQLSELEWVLPGPMAQTLDDSLLQMFARAGVSTPAQITRCDALAAMALIRQSDAICLMPWPLLGQPESRGLVSLGHSSLQAPPVDLLLLSRAEVPLTLAAAYCARCLTDAMGHS